MDLVLSLVASAILTFLLVPLFIGVFQRRKIGQTTREEGPTWHQVKTGTPTMGGIVFISVAILILVGMSFLQPAIKGELWTIALTFLLFGGIGFIDDFIAVFHRKNEGLTAKQKFVLQLLFSGLAIGLAYWQGQELVIPFFKWQWTNVWVLIAYAFIWITGFSNAVNLTDGLDGLATGLNIIAYSSYFYLAIQAEQMGIALACLTTVGALLGFLYYNRKPAQIFMGDVGSLALGAGLAVISLLLNHPWSLLIIGLVFVIETLSVILQVFSFKLTGKRIFRMSPIHHHFELGGWSEEKVVAVFWLVGLLASVIYFVL